MSNDATIKISNIVSIIENELSNDDEDQRPADKHSSVRTLNMGCSGVKMPIPTNTVTANTDEREELFFAKPTFSERFVRYFVIVIYLAGLCSLGFFLSIYYIFFWDSRMPPIYRPAISKKPLVG